MARPGTAVTAPGRYAPIEDYGLVGDCHSAALVSAAGSIDWACLQRFDAGSMFARLLDADHGGYWSIAPVDGRATARRYVDDTMVLATVFTTPSGEARLYDAFSMRRR